MAWAKYVDHRLLVWRSSIAVVPMYTWVARKMSRRLSTTGSKAIPELHISHSETTAGLPATMSFATW